MPRLIWTKNAMSCLGVLYFFLAIENENPPAAAQTMDTIRKAANRLIKYPYSGRPAMDLEPEYQELLIPFGGSGYALFYEVIEDAIYILAVKHQKEVGY